MKLYCDGKVPSKSSGANFSFCHPHHINQYRLSVSSHSPPLKKTFTYKWGIITSWELDWDMSGDLSVDINDFILVFSHCGRVRSVCATPGDISFDGKNELHHGDAIGSLVLSCNMYLNLWYVRLHWWLRTKHDDTLPQKGTWHKIVLTWRTGL